MMFKDELKTLDDVKRVVEAGKPTSVVEKFAEMYLKSLDPRRPIVAKWQPLQQKIEQYEYRQSEITETYTDAEGNDAVKVLKPSEPLREDEYADYQAALVERDRLENGYTIPEELDEEGVVVTPEEVVPGTPWLAAIRGDGATPVPDWAPQDTQAFLDTNFPSYRKLQGVEFNGVMCSATAQDMWGLNAVKSWIEAGNTVPFRFDNGNVLELNSGNVAAFEAVWIPFRASFF